MDFDIDKQFIGILYGIVLQSFTYMPNIIR